MKEIDIENFIDSLDENQISFLRKILFRVVNRDLINKVKKIYGTECKSEPSDIAFDKGE